MKRNMQIVMNNLEIDEGIVFSIYAYEALNLIVNSKAIRFI